MWVFVGFGIVVFAVFGGFMMSGGHLAALFQPFELLMIGGAAAGSFLVANGMDVTRTTLGRLKEVFRPSPLTTAFQVDVLAMLYDLMVKARREGLLAIEREVGRPEESAIFRQYPGVAAHADVMPFVTDYFQMMVGGNLDVAELEVMMDEEIETIREESEVPIQAMTRMGDAMPGFGIVAAVLGVVHTMESVGLPPEELGLLIARALVGTFLGILLAYGFVGPLAQMMEHRLGERLRLMMALRKAILAFAEGYTPMSAVEYGRKVFLSGNRPPMEALTKRLKQTATSVAA